MESVPIDFSKQLDPSFLKDRSAVVTGGASGIGLAIATALAEAGVYVTLADINEGNGSKAAESLRARGLRAVFVQTDVTSWEAQVATFDQAVTSSSTKTVDVVVSAAGIRTQFAYMGDPASLPDHSTPQKPPTGTLDINLTGTYYTMALAQHYFARSPPHPAKQMLFISSMAGYNQSKSPVVSADYAASKFGVRGLFHQVRRPELGPSRFGGARFNMLAPFFVATPMISSKEIEYLTQAGWKVATLGDLKEGAMRCLANPGVNGRSVVICGGERDGGKPGSRNFDACDEFENGFGVREILEHRSWFGTPTRPPNVS